jgi:predicted PurR-regulated permease PerM
MEPKHVHTTLNIPTSTFVRAIIVFGLAYALWALRDLALLILTAIVIASAIEPGVHFFTRFHIPRVLAVLGMYLAAFGSLFAAVYYFLPPFLADLQGVLSQLPQYLSTLNLPSAFGQFSTLVPAVPQGKELESILGSIFAFRTAFGGAPDGTFQLVTAIFGGIASFLIVVVLSFYFAMRDTGVEDFLRIITPAKREEYVVGLWLRARAKIGLWMQGQLISSAIVGGMAYVGLTFLGVPYAFLLALVTAAFELVPIFGSILASLPAIMIAFSVGGLPLAFLVVLLYVVVNQVESNIVQPIVVNKVVGIPPLLVIIAVLIGAQLAGFLGILLAIPVAAALREFVNDFERGKREAVELA